VTRTGLLLVAVLALLARVGYEATVWSDDGPVGTLDRDRAFYQEPLYAWLVGQAYRLAPPPDVAPEAAVVPLAGVHRGIVVLQHALGVLMAVLVALLGARVLGAPVGLLAGLFAALSGPVILAESMLLKEGLGLVLWVASLHLWLDVLEGRGRARTALLGLLLGLGILLRGNAYLLLGLVLVTLLTRTGGRRRPAAACLVLAVALLALSPATIHNLRRGEAVLSTYQSGSNAAIGQPDDPRLWSGLVYQPISAGRGDARYEEHDAVAAAEAAEGRRLSGREVSAWWWRQVVDHVRARPGTAALRVALKLAFTFHGEEVPDVKDWRFMRQAVPWLAGPVSDLTWLGPLGLAGFLLLSWRGRGLLVVRGGLLVIALSLALFYVMGRYRLAAAPSLWILSAGALVAGWRTLRGSRSAGRRVGVVTLGAGLIVLGQLPLLPGPDGRWGLVHARWDNLLPVRSAPERELAVSWSNLASVELDRALRAVDPRAALAHRDAAAAACRRALELAPLFPAAREKLVRIEDLATPWLTPRPELAVEQAWRLLLVTEGERTGRPVSDDLQRPLAAVRSTIDELWRLPSRPGAERFVGRLLVFACRRVAQGLRQPTELPLALVLVDRALALDEETSEALVQRGLILKRMERLDEAEVAYREALARGVDTVELHNNLGNLLVSLGRRDEAAASFERALALDPDNETVAANLRRVREER
jgi:tetratricopeptide (TPR) repeat protein